MSVTEVKLKWAGLTNGKDAVLGPREYQKVYLVKTDNVQDGPSIVKNAIGIPIYGSFYQTDTESDTRAFLADRQADLVDPSESQNHWQVVCSFSTAAYNGAGGLVPVVEPLDMQPNLEWDFHDDKEPAYFAYDRNDNPIPIVNSAGDFYDPPLERDFSRLILKVTKNFADYDPLVAYRYANTVNSDNWLGFPKWTILCKPFRGIYTVDKGTTYWKVPFEFHFDFRGWLTRLWDAGLREFFSKQDVANKRVPPGIKVPGYYHMKNDDGTFVSEPQLLNGRGFRLVPPGGVLTPEKAREGLRMNSYRLYRQMPFIPLGVL